VVSDRGKYAPKPTRGSTVTERKDHLDARAPEMFLERHPVRQTDGFTVRSFNLRQRPTVPLGHYPPGYGDRVRSLSVLPRVPPAGSIRQQRPSLPRVLQGAFPGFDGTTALCDSLGPWHHPSLPSRGATRRRVCAFAPSGPEHQTAGRGFVSRFPSPAIDAWRPSGPPKFLENPRVPMPCSSTPAGPTHQATVQWSRRGPRYVHDEGSHDTLSFGAP
jgi:hypothetical protein